MGTPRTQEEIEAEVQKLRDLKPRVRPTTIFGDSNTAAIQAQITALEERWPESLAYATYEDGETWELPREGELVIDAIHWANSDDGIDAPSLGWQPLVIGGGGLGDVEQL